MYRPAGYSITVALSAMSATDSGDTSLKSGTVRSQAIFSFFVNSMARGCFDEAERASWRAEAAGLQGAGGPAGGPQDQRRAAQPGPPPFLIARGGGGSVVLPAVGDAPSRGDLQRPSVGDQQVQVADHLREREEAVQGVYVGEEEAGQVEGLLRRGGGGGGGRGR